ncbi:CAP domain-containing protein [Streptomyces sp. NBC_01465]|uniref:CAP domain-containing protein n=1 Tax=Streptomyces sp. NBC_01465 TaxID=2903878 RepID=UPI002E364A9D|nr:CAP domain-containing protein [Streptomyces sp. NBC_01465]
MRRVVVALVAALVVGGGVGPVRAAESVAYGREGARAYYPDVERIVCEINQERVRRGLVALGISDAASGVARAHARDMAKQGELSGVGSDGRDLRTRLADAGLYSAYVSEYMLAGYHHDGYFADMATDPDPRNEFYKVLMDRKVSAIGIGYDRDYWDVDLLGPHRKLVTRAPACVRD